MKLNEVRKKYLEMFKKLDHSIISSSSIVPNDDPTTLFTGSGMQPLVPYLLGKNHPKGSRLVNSQKCFRANDFEEVGDNRHTTFFEMLGNWSLGEYFKKEQIEMCFKFLTDKKEGLGLDANKLFVSVYAGDKEFNLKKDEESVALWQKLFKEAGCSFEVAHIGTEEDGDKRGMKENERIFYYGSDKNWWSRAGEPKFMTEGEIGGGDTEVFYDFGEKEFTETDRLPHPNVESSRFVEICNSVFMEYKKTKDGFIPLEKKNVDFGGGLERLTAATIDSSDVFDIDIFKNAREVLERESGKRYKDDKKSFRIILDHLRSALFLAVEVVPSNKDRGYILRRLVRKALFISKYKLGGDYLEVVVNAFRDDYKDYYKEVDDDKIIQNLIEEKEKFNKTIEKGKKVFDKKIETNNLTEEDVFDLYSTYGFPYELTEFFAKEKGIEIDKNKLKELFEKHKEVSKKDDSSFKGGLADNSEQVIKYHTATHLLHQALRDVLGSEVHQKGSNITKERLRFDFSYDKKMSEEEVKDVEKIVNQKINDALVVSNEDMKIEEAEEKGAIGLFDYSDIVRVYSIGDYSFEFCGGPHVKNTKELGVFKIIKEQSISSGVRRIKAVLK